METVLRQAKLRADGPPLRLRVVIGDGLRADWTAKLLVGEAVTHTLFGRSDGAGGVDALDAAAFVDEGVLEWIVVVFGPSADSPYHVEVDLLQGGASAFERPVRLAGTAPARKTTLLRGEIRPKRSA